MRSKGQGWDLKGAMSLERGVLPREGEERSCEQRPRTGVGRRLLLEQKRRRVRPCRPAPTMSQSSPRLVNQMSLRLVNRCQQREIGQWILCGPARLKPPRAEAEGPAGWRGALGPPGVHWASQRCKTGLAPAAS